MKTLRAKHRRPTRRPVRLFLEALERRESPTDLFNAAQGTALGVATFAGPLVTAPDAGAIPGIDDVLAKEEKPPLTHVVLTGRNAKEELIAIADLVTEMTLIKHPFRSGIKAQPGVEF